MLGIRTDFVKSMLYCVRKRLNQAPWLPSPASWIPPLTHSRRQQGGTDGMKKSKANRTKPSGTPEPVSPVVLVTRSVRPFTRLLLFVRAGGRCQFDGCNGFLLEHPLTITKGNFAEVAHIVAFSREGPRGSAQSRPADVNDVRNLMLLGPQCHKLIDDSRFASAAV